MDFLRNKLRGRTPSWGRGSSPSPAPSPATAPRVTNRNESINYMAMFEKEKHEKELFSERLLQLENQQKILEKNLKRFLDLKREMNSFQREAEETDRVVDEFIKAAVPHFASNKRHNEQQFGESGTGEKRSRFLNRKPGKENENPSSSYDQGYFTKESGVPYSDSGRGDSIYHAQPVQADPDLPSTPDPDQPSLPNVQYEWDETYTSPSPCSPFGRFKYSTSSRTSSRLDELKLNLQFDVNSRKLPTKLQLEIKDKKGRVVFRKRQNVYYVKVQEKLATLDADEDYIMTVTSITGPRQSTEEVKIHNKFYSPLDSDFDVTEAYSLSEVTESMTVPLVTETLTPTPMTETCRSPSEASITSGFDEKSIDSIFDLPIRSMESAYEEVVSEVSCTPTLPDLEEVVEVTVLPSSEVVELTPPLSESRPKEPVVTKKTPFLLLKQPVIPEVLYRWQLGFRKGPTGYRKVPVLKLQFKYDFAKGLLPKELDVVLEEESKSVRIGQGVGNVELTPGEGEELLVGVVSKDRTGKQDVSIPKFEVKVKGVGDSELNQWYTEQPVLMLTSLQQQQLQRCD